ncbi:DUF805 domain-containing protein [Escherichia coli]|uniref:DUF805 domain-containing protein n=1 Tax=Escherichia coli TaxID=562 RepID=UPI001EFAFC38|nr:DUF805 domain-containing protein [Escherichia coli]MCG8282610.1 DUF805 domain-containing protein [Escherichia coli]
MTSLKTSIKTITYLSDTGCLEIQGASLLPYLSMLYLLATFLPVLALAIRRLHDTDRSGAWALLFFVPFIGWLVLLVFFCTEGTSGSNRYGNDPKFGSN